MGDELTFDNIDGTARHDPSLPYFDPDGEMPAPEIAWHFGDMALRIVGVIPATPIVEAPALAATEKF